MARLTSMEYLEEIGWSGQWAIALFIVGVVYAGVVHFRKLGYRCRIAFLPFALLPLMVGMFGKPDCLDFVDYGPFLNLRSGIVWYQPSRLAQGRLNYTNDHDVIHYFIKGKRPNCYNLDAIRVAQLVELEHRLRCGKVPSVQNGQYGKSKFNDDGKNPGDVWGDIKQLTYKSNELVSREALNTIQKPEKLIDRIVLAISTLHLGGHHACWRQAHRNPLTATHPYENHPVGSHRISVSPRSC